MITPETVIAAIVTKLTTVEAKAALGITTAVEGSEDMKSEDLTPPYCVVWSDFNEDALLTDDGTPNNIPVDIVIACVSNEHKTVKESFSEAFILAVEVIKLVHDEYELPSYEDELVDEFIRVKCKSVPLKIGRKSAAISSVLTYFKYEIPLINNE